MYVKIKSGINSLYWKLRGKRINKLLEARGKIVRVEEWQ
jgi:hypothetical protein